MTSRQVSLWMVVFGFSALIGIFSAIFLLPHLFPQWILAVSGGGLGGGLLLIVIAFRYRIRKRFLGMLLLAGTILPFSVFAFGMAILHLWWLMGLALIVLTIVTAVLAQIAQRRDRQLQQRSNQV